MIFLLPGADLRGEVDPGKFEGLLNKLLAPGPLMAGHENLEHTDCLKCHDAGGGIPNKHCTDCHTGIETQIKLRKSFHGLMGGKSCIDCHSDHKGRDFNAMRFDEKNFDHTRTGFKLEGGHRGVECGECHQDKRTNKPIRQNEVRYFGTTTSCNSCHRDDDIHFFKGKFAKVECSQCHTVNNWQETQRFDHKKQTGYALQGSHSKVSCEECHTPLGKNQVKYDFPGLKTKKCRTCHDDHHGRRLSPKFQNGSCDTCHTQVKWPIARFDHRVTSFPLKGKHAVTDCAECHSQAGRGPVKRADFQWAGLKQNCQSCHADYHGYQSRQSFKTGNLGDCKQCHNESGWKANLRFNHNSQTRFPLEGKHLKNNCFDCHRTLKGRKAGPVNSPRMYHFKALQTKTCNVCHKSPHSSAFHKRFNNVSCASCHTPKGWNIMAASSMLRGDANFHDRTRFPLTGKHKAQNCKSCHLVKGKEVYKFPGAEKGFCANCHTNVHKKQFSRKFSAAPCALCHTTSNFVQRKPFNHSQTAYPITGAHKKIAGNCSKCHVPTRQLLPTKPPKRASKFQFAFEKSGFCENCHTNIHRGQFSKDFLAKTSCRECHTTSDFVRRKSFNHNLTNFKLTGKHAKIKDNCFKCHIKTKRMLPTQPPKPAHLFQFKGADRGYCENCHVNEHKNMFSKKFYSKPCITCHDPVGWTKLKAFNHNQTSFRLRYKHKQVDCKKCHVPTKNRFKHESKSRKGRYQFAELRTKNCQTCHKDPHRGANGARCTKCHTEAGWQNADNFHRDFTLEGVHFSLGCDECHINDRQLKGASEDCLTCHGVDDPHNGFLPNCKECHTQNFWEATTFSHDLTQFPLRGIHRLTDCRSCHNQGNYQALPTDCIGCHALDAQNVASPSHASSRFQACEQCHNSFSFK